MTNVKKLGLTALAGSLVATSAYAGALDVTGTAKVTYATLDETEVTVGPVTSFKVAVLLLWVVLASLPAAS